MPRLFFMRSVFVAAFLLCATAVRLRSQAAPDLILTGGRIFTADSTRPWVEALAIRGERIVAAGTTAEVSRLARGRTRRIALGGRVVVPGFNDAHDHVGDAHFGASFATDASPTPDPAFATVFDSVRALARRTPPGTWVNAMVGPHVFEDPSAGRIALDAIAPHHPVALRAWTGHSLLLNSAALMALGIRDDVRDPFGGTYERDASGRLTGVLQDYAEWAALRRLFSALPQRALVDHFRQYASEGARLGITSVQDMNGYLDPATTVRVLREANLSMRFRVIPYPMTDATGLRGAEWLGVNPHPAPLTVIAGVKWILDGTPIERRALMRAPYADRPGWYGQLQFPVDTVRAILATALETRVPLAIHVVGDSAARLVVGLMQSLAPDSVWRPLRVRIEHGDGVGADLLPIVRRLGIVIVLNPTHFAFPPDLLQARFGGQPAGFQNARSLLARSLLAAGIPIAIASDGPRNPFVNIMFANTNPNNPSDALTREQAVTAYTHGSAYAEFAEREKGTLAVGMLADLAVLSQDIFTVPAAMLPGTTSMLTLVGGKIVRNALRASTTGAEAVGNGLPYPHPDVHIRTREGSMRFRRLRQR
jgi:predicted amidohydrolase YtcJ